MFILIVIIHILVSLVIIGLVLLQSGKGADIGSAFGGAGSQAVFGSMGTPTVLGKITTVAATAFLITSFSLAVLSHKRAETIMVIVPARAGLVLALTVLMRDLRDTDVNILTLGQYLRPSVQHLPVARYYSPEEFAELGEAGRAMGFAHVESGPLVRSSYHAKRHLDGVSAGNGS